MFVFSGHNGGKINIRFFLNVCSIGSIVRSSPSHCFSAKEDIHTCFGNCVKELVRNSAPHERSEYFVDIFK